MQTPAVVLNIGADVAKDEIVAACSEGSFPVRKVPNQRAAVLAFLKGLPAGSRIGVESTTCSIPRIPTTMPRPLGYGARPIVWMPSSSPA
jgi:hypothetical protein